MEVLFTLGKWHATRRPDRTMGIDGPDGPIVPRGIESTPDALLMAAAPALFDALRDLLHVMATDALVPESVSYMRAARKAIARVQGKA